MVYKQMAKNNDKIVVYLLYKINNLFFKQILLYKLNLN